MKPKQAVDSIIESIDSDLFLLSGNINDATVDALINIFRAKPIKRENCALILTTYGGDPDAGYRLVRTIKRYYRKFILYVLGSCKSTGTLISLGADEIIMGDFGEFGPLDIQLTKDDEMSSLSGLSYTQSIESLTEQIFKAFEHSFLALKQRSAGSITTKTAAEVGSKLAVGLLSPVSAQIDPIKLGEVLRAINIARAYGSRIAPDKEEIITQLIENYPSHGFVIDYTEAKTIFPNVREVNEMEKNLERAIFHITRKESPGNSVVDEIHHSKEEVDEDDEGIDNSNHDVPSDEVNDETESSVNTTANEAEENKMTETAEDLSMFESGGDNELDPLEKSEDQSNENNVTE